MYHGRLRAERQLAIGLAGMVAVTLFGSATKEALVEFVRTGVLCGSSEPAPEPYDQDFLRGLARDGLIGTLRGG